jgi:Domain of unknown function (DUF1918)
MVRSGILRRAIVVVQVGNRVMLESEKVGQQPQSGTVTGVEGHLVRVRWDSGKETAFIPAAGSLTVVGKESEEASASGGSNQ